MSSASDVVPQPSATVVLLRDSAGAVQVLLVRRSRSLDFHGGAWVFPGGRIEQSDFDSQGDIVMAARRAAVREAREEIGLEPDGSRLILLSRWTTPAGRPKRFLTWFFAAQAPAGQPRVDGGEISAHAWMTPEQALERQRAGELELPPPTFVTLHSFLAAPSCNALLEHLRAQPAEQLLPRPHPIDGGVCSLYPGDAGYESGDVHCDGPRHRLWMLKNGWTYERDRERPL